MVMFLPSKTTRFTYTKRTVVLSATAGREARVKIFGPRGKGRCGNAHKHVSVSISGGVHFYSLAAGLFFIIIYRTGERGIHVCSNEAKTILNCGKYFKTSF